MIESVFYIATFSIIILTVFFVWNEPQNFSLNKTINSQKIAEYFTCLGAIATVMTLLFIYKQLIEINVDRKASVLPYLIPKETTLFTLDRKTIVVFPTAQNQDPLEISRPFFYNEVTDPTNISKPTASVKVENIGKGNARLVKIHWIYDHQTIKEFVKDVYESDLTIDNISDKEILSTIKTESGEDIRLPISYMACCGTKINKKEIKKPALKLRLTYNNILGDTIVDDFNVEIHSSGEWVNLKFIPLI